jgi:transposase
MERIAMSQEERDELDWLKRAKEGSLTQREAARKIEVSDRWVRALIKRMSKQGDAAVVHGLRWRPSNRKLPAETQRQALAILKQPDWHDLGPTFAVEQLAKRHRIEVGKETLREWMIDAGMWRSKSQQLQEVHCWRPRRSAFGELVQWDTSEHDWLEGRGPVRYLVRMIDDATSWSWGRFVEGEASLRTAIQNFAAHHRGERSHQGLGNQFISPGLGHLGNLAEVQRCQRLGGTLNYYYRAAA